MGTKKENSRKKGFSVEKKFIKNVIAVLQKEINAKEIKSVPKDISNFIKEAQTFDDEGIKNYSIERTLKLKGLFLSFVSLHDLKDIPEIKEFMDLIQNTQKTYSTATAYFSNTFNEIYTLLEPYPFREFGEAKIYFVDENARNILNKHKNILEGLISSTIEKRNIKFNKIVNFLNPEHIAIFYSVKYVSKYQYISKQESIEKYLPVHYEVMKNKINKEFKELFKTHKFDVTNKRMLEDKRDAQLKTMQEEYNYLTRCIEEDAVIDIKILSYEHAPMYPEINFRESIEEKTRTKNIHLRSEVINVLWYKPVQLKSNNTVADILKNYNHAFGDVYYLQKDGKNG